MSSYTPFHLDAVRPLPSAKATVERRRIARLLLIGSEYKAYGVQDALNVLRSQRGLGAALHVPELVCATEPELIAPTDVEGAHDLWLLHTGVFDWNEANAFATSVKFQDPGAQVVLLSDDRRAEFNLWRPNAAVDRVWVWHGRPDGLLALIWLFQDHLNAVEEMAEGLPLMLLVEDKPVHYSSFVPRIFREIVDRTRAMVGPTASDEQLQRQLRLRPRVLLAETFEQSLRYLAAYYENLIGLVTDLQFPSGRELHPRAGLVLSQSARCLRPTLPIIVHTTNPAARADVEAISARFLYKRSDRWLREVRRMMLEYFGFGDFIFRDEQEREIGRAVTIREFRELIASVPYESFLFHARRYHFSTWLYIHGAHDLAREIRPLTGDGEELRQASLHHIDAYLAREG